MDGWERLGQRVALERGRYWKSRAEFARAAGVSPRVLGDVEKARRENYSEATLASIEAALGWEPGSARRIVQGGKARHQVEPDLVRLIDAWRVLSADARVLLVELAERAAHQR